MNETDEIQKLRKLHSCLTKLLSTAMTMQYVSYLKEHKQFTLEEKMIDEYIQGLSGKVHQYVHKCHLNLGAQAFDIDSTALSDLAGLASDMERVFNELIKAMRYNANYAEQYVEHDFYSQLENEHHFKERLDCIPNCVTAVMVGNTQS